ncbi:hypothetical protein AAG570_000279 [Ranatra chinensis]|uniref:Superoxide dismutase copper/zinc binding domain-containing protein n=1 Tax=Ranatra chinensis TaxID=642074 RepID=A0ABD0Z9A2_9HEMI
MFVQPLPPHGPVFMAGNVTGLPSGKHGLTIHTFGDIEKGCKTMQHHYNPNLSNHGGPADPYRHVGDLGNIETGADGVARLQETDPVISLVGAQSILGRGLVVHEKPDDLGRGGDMESLRTGNSGGALACGVIGWTSAPFPPHNQLQDIPKDEKKEK